MKPLQSLIGRKFFKLTVIERAEPVGYNKRWLCKCDCGKEKIIYQNALCQKRTKSCGCYNAEASKKRMSKGWSEIFTKELLIEEHINQKKTLREIAREKGCTVSCVMKYMKKYELLANEKIDDLTGQKFNMLTVLELSHTKNGTAYWKTKCDCGNIKIVRRGSLVRLNQVSCGCYNKNKEWKGCGDLSKSYLTRAENGARQRNLEFDITIEYAWKIYEQQKGICALSGIELIMDRQFGHNRGPKKKQTASLDRIDSTQGYVTGNIQWVHFLLNRMKSNLQENEFIDWCKKVADHRS